MKPHLKEQILEAAKEEDTFVFFYSNDDFMICGEPASLCGKFRYKENSLSHIDTDGTTLATSENTEDGECILLKALAMLISAKEEGLEELQEKRQEEFEQSKAAVRDDFRSERGVFNPRFYKR